MRNFSKIIALGSISALPILLADAQQLNDTISGAIELNQAPNSGLGFNLDEQNNIGATDDRTNGSIEDTVPGNSFNRVLDEGSVFGQRGVWFKWTSSVSQPITIEIEALKADSEAPVFDPTLAVFEYFNQTTLNDDPTTESSTDLADIIEGLFVVGVNDDRAIGEADPRVNFFAQEGYEYWFLVGGYNQSEGDFISNPSRGLTQLINLSTFWCSLLSIFQMDVTLHNSRATAVIEQTQALNGMSSIYPRKMRRKIQFMCGFVRQTISGGLVLHCL